MSESSEPAPPSSAGVPPVWDRSQLLAAPTTFFGILRRIGPGMILAGSIVGSGELIATTRTGSEAGFSLLWLILIGCLIKVFVQIELGRHAIGNSQTTLTALAAVPGPRLTIPLGSKRATGNWITWFWLLMFCASIGQLGGIVGGVGQAMAISWPLSEEGKAYNQMVDDQVTLKVKTAQLRITREHHTERGGDATAEETSTDARLEGEIAALKTRVAAYDEQAKAHAKYLETQAEIARVEKAGGISKDELVRIDALKAELPALKKRVDELGVPPKSSDDKTWALILGVVTSVLLVAGRYRFIEWASIIMVATFTIVTVGNVLALQTRGEWAVRWSDIVEGLSFKLPPGGDGQSLSGKSPLATALAAFGIIGVGASELMAYPYWCIEKGYARFTGRSDGSAAWAGRALGWMRVMKWDAWCCMILYTVATVAFYLLGAAILFRTGLHPGDSEMIRTLTGMYEPVFGSVAPLLFLVGAFAVLYSTYFSATAANARLAADVIPSFGIAPLTDSTRRRWVKFFSGFFPMLCVLIYCVFPNPVTLILISGVMQALLLPMLGAAAIYFRYKQCDDRLKPGIIWDGMLWLSFAGFFVVGAYLAYVNVGKWFG